MQDRGVDFLFVTPSSDLIYFFDVEAHASERLLLLIIPKQGKPDLVIANFERPHAAGKEELVSVHTWEEHERPLDLVQHVVSGVKVADDCHLRPDARRISGRHVGVSA